MSKIKRKVNKYAEGDFLSTLNYRKPMSSQIENTIGMPSQQELKAAALDMSNLIDSYKFANNTFGSGAYNSLISGAGNFANSAISGNLSSGAGNAISGLANVAGALPGVWGAVTGAGLNIVGGLWNRAFGSNINEENVKNFESQNAAQSNVQFNAASTNDLLAQSNFNLLDKINKSDVGSDGWFSHKAENLTNKLNDERSQANRDIINNFNYAVQSVERNSALDALRNITANGGPLTMRYTGMMSPFGNRFDNGGIYIKPENRGKFTALKEKTGKSSTWFKEHGTPAQKKMATFALNARKWKHANGGELFNTHGGIFSNGLTYINEGGTHESNPLEGVQMGTDPQGVPNLVEEGEVIFNDYVFSNRMRVPKAVRQKYKLRDKKGVTFADAVKQLSKESEERPNDPISKNGLESVLGELASVQEEERMKKLMKDPEFMRQLIQQLAQQQVAQETQQSQQEVPQQEMTEQMYAYGGKRGNIYKGLGIMPNWITDYSSLLGEQPTQSWGDYVINKMYEGVPDVAPPLNPSPTSYKASSITSTPTPKKSNYFKNLGFNNTSLRYAPVVTSGIGTLTDTLGLTNKPDYTSFNALMDNISNATYTPIAAPHVGGYLSPSPIDMNYVATNLNNTAAANRRAIVNSSSGNSAAARVSLLAADTNAQRALGNAYLESMAKNRADELATAQHNFGIDKANAEADMQAAIANLQAQQALRDYNLKGLTAALSERSTERRQSDAMKSANLTNFVQGLGDIGSENIGWNQLKWALVHGVFGPMQDYIGKGFITGKGSKSKKGND